jgi:hypothetical protein
MVNNLVIQSKMSVSGICSYVAAIGMTFDKMNEG